MIVSFLRKQESSPRIPCPLDSHFRGNDVKVINIMNFILSLFTPVNIFVILAIMAVIIFFIMRCNRKKQLKKMDEEDAWMQSLDKKEWE
jgi:hypothetical protein